MARVLLECHSCGARYDVSKRTPGKRVRCKRCDVKLRVPDLEEAQAKAPKRSRTRRVRSLPLEDAEAMSEQLSLMSGEIVEDIKPVERKSPLKPSAVISSLIRLLKRGWGRFLGFQLFVFVVTTVVLIIAALFTLTSVQTFSGIEGDAAIQARAMELTQRVWAVVFVFLNSLLLAGGFYLGSDLLRESKADADAIGFSQGFADVVSVLKRSVIGGWRVLIINLGFVIAAGLGLVLCAWPLAFKEGVMFQLGSVVMFPVVIAFPVVLFIATSLAMVGVTAEERPILFSLKRGLALTRSEPFAIALAFLFYTPLLVLVEGGVYFGSLVIAGPAFGFIMMNFTMTVMLGLFTISLHHELVRDESEA